MSPTREGLLSSAGGSIYGEHLCRSGVEEGGRIRSLILLLSQVNPLTHHACIHPVPGKRHFHYSHLTYFRMLWNAPHVLYVHKTTCHQYLRGQSTWNFHGLVAAVLALAKIAAAVVILFCLSTTCHMFFSSGEGWRGSQGWGRDGWGGGFAVGVYG